MSETIQREYKTIRPRLQIPVQGGPNRTLQLVVSFVRIPATATTPVRYEFVGIQREDGLPLTRADWDFLTQWSAANGDAFRNAP